MRSLKQQVRSTARIWMVSKRIFKIRSKMEEEAFCCSSAFSAWLEYIMCKISWPPCRHQDPPHPELSAWYPVHLPVFIKPYDFTDPPIVVAVSGSPGIYCVFRKWNDAFLLVPPYLLPLLSSHLHPHNLNRHTQLSASVEFPVVDVMIWIRNAEGHWETVTLLRLAVFSVLI